MTFFPKLPSVNENSEQESNPTLYLLFLYLPGLAFLVCFTNPNKQLLNVKSVLNSLDHQSSAYKIYRFIIFMETVLLIIKQCLSIKIN